MKYPGMIILIILVLGMLQTGNCQSVIIPENEIQYTELPNQSNVWVFIMAGQSNMAGRGKIEAQDTITNPRIFTINEQNTVALAKEPLHYYEPKMTGLDCGMLFASELLKSVPDSISIVLVPTAVGGSQIAKWLNDQPYRGVKLLSNFSEKVAIAQKHGVVKGILWHQGESDLSESRIHRHKQQMEELFSKFRRIVGNESLPIIVGEIGYFNKDKKGARQMNRQIRKYCQSDENSYLVTSRKLIDRGDQLHFNSKGQRELGKRYAQSYLQNINNRKKKSIAPIVVLTFDDATISHYTNVAPLLKKHHFGATFFVCGYPGKKPEDMDSYMNWKQVEKLNQMGFEIGNHTQNHKGVISLNELALRNEISFVEKKCTENGIPKPVSFAYPGNRSDSLAVTVLKDMGYYYARIGGSQFFEPLKDNHFLIPSYTMTDKRDEMTMKALTDLKPGQFLVFTIHEVPDPSHVDYTTSIEHFETYLKFMKANNFRVIALRDLKQYELNKSYYNAL